MKHVTKMQQLQGVYLLALFVQVYLYCCAYLHIITSASLWALGGTRRKPTHRCKHCTERSQQSTNRFKAGTCLF